MVLEYNTIRSSACFVCLKRSGSVLLDVGNIHGISENSKFVIWIFPLRPVS